MAMPDISNSTRQRVITLADVLREAPECILSALGPSYQGVLGALALGQAGLLGNAKEAVDILQKHWRRLAPAPQSQVHSGKTLAELKQAAREAGLPTRGNEATLLARLDYAYFPVFPVLVRRWAKEHRLQTGLEAVRAANNVPDSSSFSQVVRIRYKKASKWPFNLPTEILDKLVYRFRRSCNARSGRHKAERWYRTADIVAVATAFHESIALHHRYPGMESLERRLARRSDIQGEAARAAAEKAALMAPMHLARAHKAAGLQKPPTTPFMMESRGMRVSYAYLHPKDKIQLKIQHTPSLESAVDAARWAAWYARHLPNDPAAAEQRFSREHFSSDTDYWTAVNRRVAGRELHAMKIVSMMGADAAESLADAPPEILAAAARRRELEQGLEGVQGVPNLPEGGLEEYKRAGFIVTGHYLANIPAGYYLATIPPGYHLPPIPTGQSRDLHVPTLDEAVIAAKEAASYNHLASKNDFFYKERRDTEPKVSTEQVHVAAAKAFISRVGVDAALATQQVPPLVRDIAWHMRYDASRESRLDALKRASCLLEPALPFAEYGCGPAVMAACLSAKCTDSPYTVGCLARNLYCLESHTNTAVRTLNPTAESKKERKDTNKHAIAEKILRCPHARCAGSKRLFTSHGLPDHWRTLHKESGFESLTTYLENSILPPQSPLSPRSTEFWDYSIRGARKDPLPDEEGFSRCLCVDTLIQFMENIEVSEKAYTDAALVERTVELWEEFLQGRWACS